MKIFGDPPASLLLVIYLLTFTIWVVVAHDMLSADDHRNEWNVAQPAPTASTAPTDAKKLDGSPRVTSQPLVPTESKEPSGEQVTEMRVSPAPEKAEGLPVNKPAEVIRSSEPQKKSPPALRDFPAKSLRSEDWKLPTGDLRTGADSKPMGNLRGPTESNIDGSLRPDEKSLPTGSLRKDEPLPTGSLR